MCVYVLMCVSEYLCCIYCSVCVSIYICMYIYDNVCCGSVFLWVCVYI